LQLYRFFKRFAALLQIPDAKSGEKRIDAVVVDEDAVGSVDQPGCGVKILYGDGALDRYLSEIKVRIVNSLNLTSLFDVARSLPFYLHHLPLV
jgi:hypothetical protein